MARPSASIVTRIDGSPYTRADVDLADRKVQMHNEAEKEIATGGRKASVSNEQAGDVERGAPSQAFLFVGFARLLYGGIRR
jgi:hypothetical protein